MILHAKYVAPISRPILENGYVEISDGRIIEFGSGRRTTGHEPFDLGEVVLLPGFINAHTHLELSGLQGQADPAMGFVPWIERIGGLVLADDAHPEVFAAAARRGASDCQRYGVTQVCDITRRPDVTRPELSKGPLRVISCGEIVATGKIRHLSAARIAAAGDTRWNSPTLSVGISPHSPFLCEPSIWSACLAAADRDSLSICIHAAESLEELVFLARHCGPIADFLRRIRIWDDDISPVGASPIAFLARVGALRRQTLLAHVNYVSDSDIDLIARSGAAVVYCPRTHDAFGHDPHPLPRLLRAGVDVCLGTDSLASNPSLSVLDEARRVFETHPDLGIERILGMITHVPGRRLGTKPDYGTMLAGSCADLTAIPLNRSGPRHLLENILTSAAQPTATWIGGKKVFPGA